MKSLRLKTHSPEGTIELGSILGSGLKAGDTVLLTGDLGAGKTTFVKGLCLGIGGFHPDRVKSPSFTVVNDYICKIPVRHVDLYRVDDVEDFETIGAFDEDYSSRITVVEWADKGPGLPLSGDLSVSIADPNPDEREFTILADDNLLISLNLKPFSVRN